MPPDTCRTGASSVPRSPGPSAPAAARARDRSRPTTRTPRRWGSRRRAWPCGRRPTAPTVDGLWFSTADPAYLDKTNATAIHAALRLDSDAAAFDLGGAARIGRRRAATGARRRRLDPRRHVRPAHRPADQPRRGRRRRRRGRAARRRRGRCPGHRRVPRRRLRDRGVPRPVAHPGRSPLQGLGGALRRDEVRAARRAGLERGAQGRGTEPGPGGPRDRHRPARPRGARRWSSASARRTVRWSTTSR